MGDYGVCDHETLYPGIYMDLDVVSLAGGRYSLHVDTTDTVWRLKYKLSEQHGVPMDRQVLLLGDAELDDDTRVADLDLATTPVITLAQVVT